MSAFVRFVASVSGFVTVESRTVNPLHAFLYAVTKAEKELGAGTGKLKLRYVYDMFVARFEWLAKVITFDMFSMMVDEALEQMRTMLDSNEAVQKLIANEAGEGSE